jgi:hypothetical protein
MLPVYDSYLANKLTTECWKFLDVVEDIFEFIDIGNSALDLVVSSVSVPVKEVGLLPVFRPPTCTSAIGQVTASSFIVISGRIFDAERQGTIIFPKFSKLWLHSIISLDFRY